MNREEADAILSVTMQLVGKTLDGNYIHSIFLLDFNREASLEIIDYIESEQYYLCKAALDRFDNFDVMVLMYDENKRRMIKELPEVLNEIFNTL